MSWKYRGAFSVRGVNMHVWQGVDSEQPAFAVSRTSVIPPHSPVVYGSLEDLATAMGVEPPSADPRAANKASAPGVPRGLYRRPGGWVEVQYHDTTHPLPQAIYVSRGFQPPVVELPQR